MRNGDEFREVLERSPYFAGLMDDDYDLLGEGCEWRNFKAGAMLFYEGDPGGSVHLIDEGKVSIERVLDRRDRYSVVRLAVRGPGDVIGELALFDEEPRNADARALEATRVVRIRKRHLIECAQQSPELAINLIRGLSRKLRQATDSRVKARVGTVKENLLAELRAEAARSGRPHPEGKLLGEPSGKDRLTQGDLATRLSCTREVINRTLAEFLRDGLIEMVNQVVLVRDRPRLERAAEEPPDLDPAALAERLGTTEELAREALQKLEAPPISPRERGRG